MWKRIEIEPDELAPGDEGKDMYQFNFDLMCAELIQEPTGQWVAALIDSGGGEIWLSAACDSAEDAKKAARTYLIGLTAEWAAAMHRRLPSW
ncbi:MAG: hypothetical protein IPM39_29410 [Chloroflexi bacterium]|nr:hypothetical protein [Chloroflexota bacterium]